MQQSLQPPPAGPAQSHSSRLELKCVASGTRMHAGLNNIALQQSNELQVPSTLQYHIRARKRLAAMPCAAVAHVLAVGLIASVTCQAGMRQNMTLESYSASNVGIMQ